MKRIPLSLLLVLCLLAGLITPIFATEAVPVDSSVILPVDETTALPDSSAEAEQAQNIAKRDPKTFSTSAEGLAFIADFFGKNPKGTSQLISAENAVNAFIKRENLTLTQAQFDALVDFAVDKGSNMFTQGYNIEKVIKSGSFTHADLANAFFSWVLDGIGVFSEKIFAHRLREVKLFLYGSYSGSCNADFRYVIYNANGGKLGDNTVLCYPYDSTFSALPTATRSGYHFAGWYTKDDEGEHLCNGYSVKGNYRVYAHWSKTAVANPNEVIGSEKQTDFGTNNDVTIRNDVGAGVPTYANHTGWPKIPALKVSEAGVEFIKQVAGFSASSGYGLYSGYPISISNPITLDQADYVLRYNIANYEKLVDKAIKAGTVKHTQSQYDAILSLTCDLGQQWMQTSYHTYNYVINGSYDNDITFVNAFGSWCSSNGTIQPRLCLRRMEEADLYLNGDYSLNNAPYRCLLFNGNGGNAADNIEYVEADTTLKALPSATKNGSKFAGWYSKATDGTLYTVTSTAPAELVTTLYAHWVGAKDPCPHGYLVAQHKDATCTEAGYDRIACGTCGAVISETTAPALGHDYVYFVCSRCHAVDPAHICPFDNYDDLNIVAWYHPGVEYALNNGLMNGVDTRIFNPNGALTRAMLVTILYRIEKEPDVSTAPNPFDDVPSGLWYTDAVIWAAKEGIVTGTSATTFAPNTSITREQIATILYRYAGFPTASGSLDTYPDAATVSSYAVDAMKWAVGKGIINGNDGMLAPLANATRAQIATILFRYLNP